LLVDEWFYVSDRPLNVGRWAPRIQCAQLAMTLQSPKSRHQQWLNSPPILRATTQLSQARPIQRARPGKFPSPIRASYAICSWMLSRWTSGQLHIWTFAKLIPKPLLVF